MVTFLEYVAPYYMKVVTDLCSIRTRCFVIHPAIEILSYDSGGSHDSSVMISFSTHDDFQNSYEMVFRTFASGKTKSLLWRKWQLKQFWWMLEDNRDQILAALRHDLNRHDLESTSTELVALRGDILNTLANLEEWTADEYPDAGFLFGTLGRARIRKEPLGVTLIIGAWNYPVCILLQPLIAAIAAGCCAILKPSELAQATQNLVVEMIPKYMDQEAIRVVTAGPVEMGFILSHKFNHIFYTGSSKIARIVSAAAAIHLTPVTLELGGQGPAIITPTANIDISAKRIASTKVSNAGQICLAVNHVFVPSEIHDEFVERVSYWFDKFKGDEKESKNLVRIINDRNFDRLEGVLSKTEGEIVYGGQMNREDRSMYPTVVTGVSTSGKSIYVHSDIRSFNARRALRTTSTGY